MKRRAGLVVLLLAVGACTHGTSGWLLREDAENVRGEAGDAGGEAGETSSAEAGASGDAGEPARCPTRFQNNCSPSITFQNLDSGPSGQLFGEAIPDLPTTLTCITRDVCNILYRKTSELKAVTQITVIVEDYDGISETYGSNGQATIHMSSRYMQQVVDAGGNLSDELHGIFYYHGTNIYQFDGGDGSTNGWLVQGVADFVRYSAGFLPADQRMPGGNYNDGFTTTGFFFVWLDQTYPDFVYELNQSLNPAVSTMWTPQSITDITGQTVDQLWANYQTSL
ncbi:MAG TPA: basic secretory protein-like protein [Polyangiaceae bacterium]